MPLKFIDLNSPTVATCNWQLKVMEKVKMVHKEAWTIIMSFYNDKMEIKFEISKELEYK